MKPLSRLGAFSLLLFALAWTPLYGADPAEPRPLKMADVLAWKTIQSTALTNDGKWFAYVLAPNEGDAEVVLRQLRGDKELRFPCGGRNLAAGGPAFSEDSRWLAFSVMPSAKDSKQAKAPRAKLALVELATAKKIEFDNVQRFAFSGESAAVLAVHKFPPEGQTQWSGSDLIIRELATDNELNVGNVAEFAFDKKGQWLAAIIDAQGQGGNGVQLRNLTTSAVVPLDSAKATYKSLHWTEKGDALAVLRSVEDKLYQDKLYSIVGFTDLNARVPKKTVYDPHSDKSFPTGRAISANRSPAWTDDLSALQFGIHQPKKKPGVEASAPESVAKEQDKDAPSKKGSPKAADGDKPDLVLWHGSDHRLQSEQQKTAGQDRTHSDLCIYRVADKKFIRLADPTLRNVTVAPKQRWAFGVDRRPYELDGTLDGKRFHDLHVIDLQTGERKLALKKLRWQFSAAPDGTHLLYYEDGHFYMLEFATGKSYNLTRDVAASFVNDEDDHNVAHPPRQPLGWVKDSKSILLSDGWDVWQVPVQGGAGANLTVTGKKEGIRYRAPVILDREAKGFDLSGPVYYPIYGEWTKKSGIARSSGGNAAPERLLWDDASFIGPMKAQKADVFLYRRQTNRDYPDFYMADDALRNARKITMANPQQDKFAWSKGAILVDYTSAKGKKLQGALFLPANYEAHKRYPTIVYIYEKLSQSLNTYEVPAARGFNRSVYTSNGYAVFMPDISYQINDPGMSAVWCVLPGLEAAIATGVVDRARVGLQGHSWGGYQTSFLITQTDAFKAAVAGAPLTNLVSMYSSIYWNTGSANQPIFESSQGRFSSGYWDNLEAYIRNSPVFHAPKVKTPLLLLHNDKDGAVDWNQGIEYFNALRRLRKPVIMLQYKGENHGLVKPANQKDYTVRMREFFDHYLRDQPAHGWLREGVPHLQLDEHLEERARQMMGDE